MKLADLKMRRSVISTINHTSGELARRARIVLDTKLPDMLKAKEVTIGGIAQSFKFTRIVDPQFGSYGLGSNPPNHIIDRFEMLIDSDAEYDDPMAIKFTGLFRADCEGIRPTRDLLDDVEALLERELNVDWRIWITGDKSIDLHSLHASPEKLTKTPERLVSYMLGVEFEKKFTKKQAKDLIAGKWREDT